MGNLNDEEGQNFLSTLPVDPHMRAHLTEYDKIAILHSKFVYI